LPVSVSCDSDFLLAADRVEDQLVAEQCVAVRLELPRRALHGLELGVREQRLVGPLRRALQRRGVVVVQVPERSGWPNEVFGTV
jgi:hypothetical protein